MKKRTRKQIAGALAVSMMMGAPANLCSVEAASPMQKIPFSMTWEEENAEDESIEEIESETAESESGHSEPESSDEISESSTTESSINLESERNNLQADIDTDGVEEQENAKPIEAGHSNVDITDQGVLDYRTYFQGDKKPQIHLEIDKKIFEIGIRASLSESEDRDYAECDSEQDSESDGLDYVIRLDNRGIIYFDESGKKDKVSKIQGSPDDIADYELTNEYRTQEQDIAFGINGVGSTVIETGILWNEGIMCASRHVISVVNSPLYDEDFYIELCPLEDPDSVDGQNESEILTFGYHEWLKYLDDHQGWINKTVNLKVSEQGEKYYSEMHMKLTDSYEFDESDSSSYKNDGRKSYVIWAEHPDRNASTEYVENGTRTFFMGMDLKKPEVNRLVTESECYEPTRTETEQYFADDFILKGNVSDEDSGVARVEYTVDYTAGANAKWSETAVSDNAFCITLSDGCYKAIAVRAYDNAGNVSVLKKFVNDKGEPIKVIVDRTEPVLQITAKSGNTGYDGKNDSWTNQDVVYNIASDGESCPYAGIYQYEYVYEKIGEAVNDKNMTDMSEKWTETCFDGKSADRLEIKEDRNGYYYFRAVSKSGVRTKEPVKCRILIQHQLADIKPMVVNGVDETKRKNGWYNKASGVPCIGFDYPNYDIGVMSGEYDAPVTIHYTLTAQEDDGSNRLVIEDSAENNADMGVMSSEQVVINDEGKKEFVLTQDDLDSHVIGFGYDKKTGYARDGIYTLEYWVTDKAGNKSEKQSSVYKIDSHEPTDLHVVVAGNEMPAESASSILYEHFYKEAVAGNVSAQYGISGEGSMKILRAKKPGEWKDADFSSFDDGDSFDISPNIRCFLYVRAEDNAGNYTEGWTRGIVVDNMLPNQSAGKELVVEPEGANEHGFFNQDVKVRISVKDSPEDDNCAALMSVNSSVGKEGTDTITDKELFAFTKELPTDDELTNASTFETVQTIDAKVNESNEAYIEVTATDRAQNAKTSLQMLKIDVTKPVIDISFDREDGVNGRFYNQSRTATIHVNELNFDASAVEMEITRNGEPVEMALSDWTSDGSEHYASVAFTQDGDYTMEVRCTDLADNESETVQAECFTIDCTAPQVTIDLVAEADGQMHSEGYYASKVTALITVTEHNFNADDFVLDGASAPAYFEWKHEGDVHTASVPFEGDNTYLIRCAYTDMAGNAADGEGLTREFVIDTTAPMLAIAGVTDGSANSGEVMPVITVLDLNLAADAVDIAVATGRGQMIENAVDTAVIDDGSGVGYRFTMSDMNEKADDIYYLTVTACDKAGNDASLTYRFSLNRNGSAYDFADIIRLMENPYNTYLGMEDIVITEMNVDQVDEFEVFISRNGALGYKAAYEKEVQGADNIGYTYTYRIKRENFAEEGSYRLSMYSKDRAGNEVNNSIAIDGKEVEFIIDNTAPKVVIDGVETGKVYDVEAQEVGIVVTDNFRLAEAELTLVNKDNEVLDSWNYMELSKEGDTLYITIPEYREEVSLLYRIKDAAGNEVQTFRGESTALADFLVTTDKFVQFVNKPTQTPFGCTLLVLMGIAGIGAVSMTMLLLHKRRNKGKFNR